MFPWNSDIYLGTITFSKNAKEKRVIMRGFEITEENKRQDSWSLFIFLPCETGCVFLSSGDPFLLQLI